jgi:hypothetical protein
MAPVLGPPLPCCLGYVTVFQEGFTDIPATGGILQGNCTPDVPRSARTLVRKNATYMYALLYSIHTFFWGPQTFPRYRS